MTSKDRFRKICQHIGCSGFDPDLCQEKPWRCDIIRKVAQISVADIRKLEAESTFRVVTGTGMGGIGCGG